MRVVYVDDDEDELFLFAAAWRREAPEVALSPILGGHAGIRGFPGFLAPDGRPPDLVCVDLKMPVVDGLDLTRAILAAPALAGVPVLVLTSSLSEEHARRARVAGATACLTKPTSMQHTRALARALVTWLDRADRALESLRPFLVE